MKTKERASAVSESASEGSGRESDPEVERTKRGGVYSDGDTKGGSHGLHAPRQDSIHLVL